MLAGLPSNKWRQQCSTVHWNTPSRYHHGYTSYTLDSTLHALQYTTHYSIQSTLHTIHLYNTLHTIQYKANFTLYKTLHSTLHTALFIV